MPLVVLNVMFWRPACGVAGVMEFPENASLSRVGPAPHPRVSLCLQRPLLTGCYWVTFIPIRLVLFPYLLIVYPPVFLTLGVRHHIDPFTPLLGDTVSRLSQVTLTVEWHSLSRCVVALNMGTIP